MTEHSSSDNGLAVQLRQLLQAIEASGRSVLPNTNLALLQSIVDAAARIFDAAAASIALVDEEQQQLVFRVSHGAGNQEIVGMRIPMDNGIAGYVVMSGQPIAISDVQHDTRFNRSFAQTTGYVPRSILAMPLLSGDRVIGVMEVLDKIAAPSFGVQDMELLALFANQAAIAIDQSQVYEQIDQALVRGLRTLAQTASSEPHAAAADEIDLALSGEVEEPLRADLLELARLYNDIASLGEAERRACIRILAAFSEYARANKDLAGPSGGPKYSWALTA